MIETQQKLREFLEHRRADIDSWIEGQWHEMPVPFYCSFDIRDSGFKSASVDANLFPAGFNNLHPDGDDLVAARLKDAAVAFCDDLNGILLIAEKIDNNPYYLDHIHRLYSLLLQAGIPARLCRSDVSSEEPLSLRGHSGQEISLYSLERRGNRLYSGTWSPCAVLLNDDLSRASEADIAQYQGIEQTILPLPELGWFARRKSSHFHHYHEVVAAFCQAFEIDSWLLEGDFRVCQKIDFGSRVGLDCVASHCQRLLDNIKEAYRARGIDEKALCFVKSDYGTHGMGIVQIEDPDQVYSLNRKQRKSMSFGKSGEPVSQVLIQEGIPSHQRAGDAGVAEHCFYAVHHSIVGAFVRAHPRKSPYQSLNSPGMTFIPVKQEQMQDGLYPLLLVASLGLLAAAREHLPPPAEDSEEGKAMQARLGCPDNEPAAASAG